MCETLAELHPSDKIHWDAQKYGTIEASVKLRANGKKLYELILGSRYPSIRWSVNQFINPIFTELYKNNITPPSGLQIDDMVEACLKAYWERKPNKFDKSKKCIKYGMEGPRTPKTNRCPP